MNKIIIDYAIEYARTTKQWKDKVRKINKVQLHKRLFLPFKLVGVDRGVTTNCYYNNEK